MLKIKSEQGAREELVSLKKENVFQEALRGTNGLLKSRGVTPKTVFISYAWEDESTPAGKSANETLQSWLQKIAKDLGTVGVKVFLDIERMKGKMSKWMENGIEESDYILLIGTPRYKQRAGMDTNVAFEFKHILKKLENTNHDSLLLPLLYSGDFSSSFPSEVTKYLIRDFRQIGQYYYNILGIAKPLGIVPNVYSELEKNGPFHQEYMWVFELLDTKLRSLEAEIRNIKNTTLRPIADKLPSVVPYFVDRTEDMLKLNEHFNQKGDRAIIIQGLRGAGKSQLAAAYAHDSKIRSKPYKLIRWLNADSKESLKDSYFLLGDDLGLEYENYKSSEADFRKAINDQLLRYENVLLIYDNVESLDYLEKYQPSAGGNANIHILITSHRHFLDCTVLDIKEFTTKDVQNYLNQRLHRDISLNIAGQIGKELGYLPLALAYAGAYMVKYGKSPEAFLNLLQTERRQKVLWDGPELKTLAHLWNMSIEKLSAQGLEVMRLCAYLNPDNIPQTLLEKIIDEDYRDEVLFELRSQSLLIDTNIEKELFRIHPLLQEVVQRQLVQNDKSGAHKTIVEKGIKGLKAIIGKHDDKQDIELYMFWRERDFIDSQVKRLIIEGEKLKIDNVLLALLLEWAGEYQQFVATNYQESLKLYQQCLKLQEDIFGDTHPDIATSLNNIGEILKDLGQYDMALQYLERSLTMRRNIYGANNASVALSLHGIGDIYLALNQFDKALEHFMLALNIRRVVLGENHAYVAVSLNSIGDSYKAQGQFDKALMYYNNALEIIKVVFDANHPMLAGSLSNIGDIYYSKNQFDNALIYYERSLSIRKETFGNSHPHVTKNIKDINQVNKKLNKESTFPRVKSRL